MTQKPVLRVGVGARALRVLIKKCDLPVTYPSRHDRRARCPRPHTSALHTRTCPFCPTTHIFDQDSQRTRTSFNPQNWLLCHMGSCDACGVYEGQETIIDFKQSNKPKKEEWIEDYYLQLGAYSLAHNVVYNSNITQGIVLLCTVDNLFQDFRIQGVKLEEYQNKFLEKVEQYYHQRNTN